VRESAAEGTEGLNGRRHEMRPPLPFWGLKETAARFFLVSGER